MHNGKLLKENSFVDFQTPPEEFAQFLLPIVDPIPNSPQSHEEVPITSSPKKNKPKKIKGIAL